MARDTRRGGKKKVSKNIAAGVAHVNSSFNNTKILISDVQGNAIAWSSAGTMGFKGSRKGHLRKAQLPIRSCINFIVKTVSTPY